MVCFTAENNGEISTTRDCLFTLVQARSFLAPPMVWSPTHVCSNVVLLVPPTTAGCRGHCHWEGCLTFTYRVYRQCIDFFRYLEKTPENPAKPCGIFHDQPAQWRCDSCWFLYRNCQNELTFGTEDLSFIWARSFFSHNHNGRMIEILLGFIQIITSSLYLGLTTVVPPFLDIQTSPVPIQSRTSQTQFVVLLTPPNESWKVQRKRVCMSSTMFNLTIKSAFFCTGYRGCCSMFNVQHGCPRGDVMFKKKTREF